MTLVFTDTVDVTGPGDYTSGGFAPTTAGSYYWTASYSGDVNNVASDEQCGAEGETSTLAQLATAITTLASSGIVGVRLVDTATLTGAAEDATGTITFNLYGPEDSPDCTGTPVFTDTVDVAGAGDYTSGGFAPTAFGSYYWTASFSGDVNNLPADEPCGAPHETASLEAQGERRPAADHSFVARDGGYRNPGPDGTRLGRRAARRRRAATAAGSAAKGLAGALTPVRPFAVADFPARLQPPRTAARIT